MRLQTAQTPAMTNPQVPQAAAEDGARDADAAQPVEQPPTDNSTAPPTPLQPPPAPVAAAGAGGISWTAGMVFYSIALFIAAGLAGERVRLHLGQLCV